MISIIIDEFEVEVPGGNIWVKRWLPKNIISDTPIILLHDSLGSIDLWKDFPVVLAEKLSRCVIAYDRLGFGKSDARDSLPSNDFIKDEATIFFPKIKNHLGIGEYVLLGHSVGGGMSINIAACDSDCKVVITVSAQAFIEDITIKGIKDAQRIFNQPGQLERLEKWHGKKAEWVLGAWTDIWLSEDFRNWSLEDCIGNVSCPVLAIHGENDEYGSAASPEFIVKNTGGKSEMLLLENCGHVPHKEKTLEVMFAVNEFINRNI